MKVLKLIIFYNLFYFLLANSNDLSRRYESSESIEDIYGVKNSIEEKSLEDFEDDGIFDLNEYHEDSNITLFSVKKNVILNLYRRNDPDYPFIMNEDNYNDAPINNNLSTQIIIHGWLNSGDSNWVLRMKDKYFLNSDYNVIVVDWSHYAKLGYIYASNKVKKVGEYVTKVLTPLIKNNKLDTENIHIVGHCLGGHMAGFIGKTTQRNLEKNIGRITGLDVARSFYEFPFLISTKKRLVKEDALFVDIIHACGGNYGFKSAIGHADFYPNGGTSRQPGCLILTPLSCSRARSISYYTESINTKKFLATPCSSWKQFKKGKCDGTEKMIMGLHVDVKLASQVGGKFYLKTNKREPYAKG